MNSKCCDFYYVGSRTFKKKRQISQIPSTILNRKRKILKTKLCKEEEEQKRSKCCGCDKKISQCVVCC